VLIGANLMITDRTPSIIEIARRAEERGLESIFQGEHVHMPVRSVHPGSRGGEVPDFCPRFPDLFVTMAAAVAVTTRLRLGLGVVVVAQHHPLDLAKAVASPDVLSAGRVEVGVGYGWNRWSWPVTASSGQDRRAAFREKLAVVRRLRTDEVVSAEGRYVTFAPSWSWPKPVQRPHPPVLVGAAGTEATFADVAELADGWYPLADPRGPGPDRAHREGGGAKRSSRAPDHGVCHGGTATGRGLVHRGRRRAGRVGGAGRGYRALGVHRLVAGVSMTDLDALTRGPGRAGGAGRAGGLGGCNVA
jgi:probable F420-dependent oxidoreductase